MKTEDIEALVKLREAHPTATAFRLGQMLRAQKRKATARKASRVGRGFKACEWDDVAIRVVRGAKTPRFCSRRCEEAAARASRVQVLADTKESRTPPEFLTWAEPADFGWVEAREEARAGFDDLPHVDELTEWEEHVLQLSWAERTYRQKTRPPTLWAPMSAVNSW